MELLNHFFIVFNFSLNGLILEVFKTFGSAPLHVVAVVRRPLAVVRLIPIAATLHTMMFRPLSWPEESRHHEECKKQISKKVHGFEVVVLGWFGEVVDF